MFLDGISDGDLVFGTIDWFEQEGPSTFDSEFIYSLKDTLDVRDELTKKQRFNLEKIVNSLDIDKSYF